MLYTFLTLRYLPIVNTDAYWEQLPTPVLRSFMDECFQAVATNPDRTRETHIWALKNIFNYVDVSNSRFRSHLIRLLLQHYTAHPEELTPGQTGQLPTSCTLSPELTGAASGDSSDINHTVPT